MKKTIFLLVLTVSLNSFSQQKTNFKKEEITINDLLKGTLYVPIKTSSKTNLVVNSFFEVL